MIIKVCGMCDSKNISQVASLGVNWIGMIFWKQSPRNVTMVPTNAGTIPDRAGGEWAKVNSPYKRVGVFVDEMAQTIVTHVVNYGLDLVQLHGHESPTLISNLRATLDPDIKPGIKFIKAISIGRKEDIQAYKAYEDCVDYFLFDTKCDTTGGSGEQFDWSLLQAYDGNVPFLLSGGIGPDDAKRVAGFHHPQFIGIDLNSRFETEPGIKDIDKLRTFIAQL